MGFSNTGTVIGRLTPDPHLPGSGAQLRHQLVQTIKAAGVKIPSWYGYSAEYVVPTWAVKKELVALRPELEAQFVPVSYCAKPDKRTGRPSNISTQRGAMDDDYLSFVRYRGAAISGKGEASVKRRLYDVMNENTLAVDAEWAETFVACAGYTLDDRDLPVLPGGRFDAIDLLQVRASEMDESVTYFDVMEYVPTLLQLCVEIISFPDECERLRDEAPFNCLRSLR